MNSTFTPVNIVIKTPKPQPVFTPSGVVSK